MMLKDNPAPVNLKGHYIMSIQKFAPAFLALALPVFVLAAAPQARADNDAGIYALSVLDVNVDVSVKAAPDIAEISAGVVTQSPQASIALAENAKKMAGVFAALKKAGIADTDIQTNGLNVSPQYDYSRSNDGKPPVISGYQASNNVTVIIRDVKKTGTVIDTLVAQGANQINGPTFTVSKPEPLLDQARIEAVKKARARADLLAGAAGMKVKRVITLSESRGMSYVPRPMMMAAKATEAADTPVAAGEVDLTASVTAKYEIE